MSKQNKISVMHITYDMRIGGTEMVIKNIIEGSDSNLFDMSIFCIESPLGPFAVDLLNKGIKIDTHTRRAGFDLSLVTSIRRHIKGNDINVIHCHQYTPYVYGVLAAIGTKTNVIFTEHGRFYPDSSSWKRKLINPLLNRFTAATTAISSATKDALVIYEKFPAKSIEVVYNGIAPVTYDEQDVTRLKKHYLIADHELCLGTIARLDPIKNHTMMLKAFRQVIDAGIAAKLVIVGDGEERQNIETLINDLDLSTQVILTGYEAKPQALLAMMDIYLLSSLSEGTSMTLLEAMSLGKPCVVTDAGGNPEIIKNNINGLVTPNNNPDKFSDAIKVLALSKKQRLLFGQSSRQIFAQKFTRGIMFKSYFNLYLNMSNREKS
ncbi:glycosyltransferase [Paraglaciecola sp.]|uniref:glycosyltransferase n=1 Tax=Paraglaciecola sp. TaxID=1920173 RepID=UPI0030F4853E